MSLSEARADIRLQPGAFLAIEKLRTAVVKAGFTPTWIRFEAVGQVLEQNNRLVFAVKGSTQQIPLAETEALAEIRQKAAGKEIVITVLIPAKEEFARIEGFRVQP